MKDRGRLSSADAPQARHVRARAAGLASLVAAGTLVASLFPAFVAQSCPSCSAAVDRTFSGLSSTLADSPDAWVVLWIAGVVSATAVLFLAGVAPRLMAKVNAVTSLAAVGIAIFEGAMAFPRVLGSYELLPGPPTFALQPGFYLLLGGAVVATGAAATMLFRGGDGGWGLDARGVRLPSVVVIAGTGCLASLAVAVAGMFPSFAELNCGFGCPPNSHGLPFGPIAGTIDGWVILALLVAAGLAVGLRLASERTPLASGAAVVFALLATALISFDSLNAGSRILGWPFGIPTSPGPGYFVLQGGAGVATVLSLVLAAADRDELSFLHRADVAATPIIANIGGNT